jgi:hypothetical protein
MRVSPSKTFFNSNGLAGAEGFEPSSPVLETGSLPLAYAPVRTYFVSLWFVRFPQFAQNFFISSFFSDFLPRWKW